MGKAGAEMNGSRSRRVSWSEAIVWLSVADVVELVVLVEESLM